MLYRAVALFFLATAAHSIRTPREDVLAAVARVQTPASVPSPLARKWTSLLARMHAEVSAFAPGDAECALDMVAYEFALSLQPERAPHPAVFYALQLERCGATPPAGPAQGPLLLRPWNASELSTCACTFFVNASGGSDSGAGSMGAPFASISRAVAATRTARAPGTGLACIVLREGTHAVGASTIVLNAADSGLVFTGAAAPDGAAWVSGGVKLPALAWSPYNVSGGANIYVADIPQGLIASMPGLNTEEVGASTDYPVLRLRRAQFPNFDFEYGRKWINSGKAYIDQWIKPPVYDVPEQFYIDLKAQGLKNDSTMDGYNRFGLGFGGPCAVWRGGIRDEVGWSYWCSNNSAGGGAGQDQSYMLNGYLGLPMGMIWNPTAPQLPHFDNWDSLPPRELWGPLWDNLPSLGAYQNPGWFTSHFAVTGIDASARMLNMTADGVYPAGGWQGGRNWWGTAMGTPHNNLTSGPWFVENAFAELDAPAEYCYDVVTSKLYLFYNSTGAPPADYALWVPQLEVLFNLSGTPAEPVTDVTFAGLAFRDQRKSLLDQWLVPSGGDWSLRRAGALHFEGTERATVTGSAFVRMDGNAVFLAAYNRNATIEHNECVFNGMSCVVTYGYASFNDATAGEQPWGTQINYNFMHEFGVQEMQSSGWYSGKAALTRTEGNIFFNMPRAAANFNDGMGMGHVITRNLVFNTCRESGDQ